MLTNQEGDGDAADVWRTLASFGGLVWGGVSLR